MARLSLEEVQEQIVKFATYYFNAQHGVVGAASDPDYPNPGRVVTDHRTTAFDELGRVVMCCIVMRNGFVATGTAAVIDPSFSDVEKGKKAAHATAMDQVWEVMAYSERGRLVRPIDVVSADADLLGVRRPAVS